MRAMTARTASAANVENGTDGEACHGVTMANPGVGGSSTPSRSGHHPGSPSVWSPSSPPPPSRPSSSGLVRVTVRSAVAVAGSTAWIRTPLRQLGPVGVAEVGEHPVDGEGSSHALGPLTRMATESNSWSTASAPTMSARTGRVERGRLHAVAQLVGALEVEVAPRAVLRPEARGCRTPRPAAVGPRCSSSSAKTTWFSSSAAKREVAGVDVLLGLGHHDLGAAEGLDVAGGRPRPAGAATGGPGCRRTSPGSAGRWP